MPIGRLAFVLPSIVVAALGCSSSSGDDASRAGEECSRGPTTAACDDCAQKKCAAKYQTAFREPTAFGSAPGTCIEQAHCISHCACGDTDCYDHCAPSIACSASLFELRNCEAVFCATECTAALAGVTGACIELARCCESERMPDGQRLGCRGVAAEGKVSGSPTINYCEGRLEYYRGPTVAYCD